jgi:hypothetical protein
MRRIGKLHLLPPALIRMTLLFASLVRLVTRIKATAREWTAA